MKYQLSKTDQAKEAREELFRLTALDKTVELKEIKPRRTIPQNSYYHLLLGIFGLEVGYTVEEAKVLHKREVSSQIFVYEKNGKKFLRSSADLTTKEMTDAIEQFKKYAAENGIDLPDAIDNEKLMYYENLIEQQGGRYL